MAREHPEVIKRDGLLVCDQHGELIPTHGRFTGRLMYECPTCGVYVLDDVWQAVVVDGEPYMPTDRRGVPIEVTS